MLLPKNTIGIFMMLMLFSFNTDKLFSQNRSAELSAPLNSDADQRNILEDKAQWKEIESKRSLFSSTFLTPDNRTIIHYSKEPVNYYKNGVLVPINVIPARTSEGLTAADQPNRTTITNTGGIEIATGDNTSIIYSGNCKINGVTTTSASLENDGIYASMNNIFPGVNKTFEFRFNSVKYNYVLTHSISSGADLIFEEDIVMPAGSMLQPDINFGRTDKNGWVGALSITSNGHETGSIRGAICYDANKNYCTAAYKLETENGKQKIRIIVPDEWINDPSRSYPVTIDPLVTGPTSTWPGSYVPSCIAPASSADSILVTIPAQISITGLFVSGSYYASPFTSAVMSDGSMFFSTSCNNSTSFTVAPPTGSTAGTGYLTAYDLHSPLLCCFPQSCSAQTFYLLMHISRTGPGTGCNTSYIYHDPFSGYPFSAYVEGHTIESYGLKWNATPNTICSDVCNITGTVYIKYGVPPYTITHPWMTGSVTAGVPTGCSASVTPKALNLTIPTCPWTCDTITVLSVPPPIVTDACGNVLTGLVPKVIHIKETPSVTAAPNPATACSDVPFSLTLNSCIAGSTISWSGHGGGGTGTTITDIINNSGTTPSATIYSVSAISNGCLSDTINVIVNTDPTPVAGFNVSPQPLVINTPGIFTDNTSVYGGTATNWLWDFGDNTIAMTQNPTYIYTTPGIYHVCLAVQTSDGCLDTLCQDITVIPAEIVLPNVITPNGDNMNEFLYFKYLEFFGKNTLKVYDRWGRIVFEKGNYTNDWNAEKLSDGTYYYILKVENGKEYPGFVQVIGN